MMLTFLQFHISLRVVLDLPVIKGFCEQGYADCCSDESNHGLDICDTARSYFINLFAAVSVCTEDYTTFFSTRTLGHLI